MACQLSSARNARTTHTRLLGGCVRMALGICVLNTAAHADDTQLNPVFVTATRTAESAQSVLAPVSVLERADIERLQSKDFTDLIARLPGVDISRDGGRGALSSLYLRGTNADHTLFLVDGQRVSSATLGSTSFQFLDPQQIEKVEVVRGPKSSLYGSDAIGGVIQIFTRRSTAEPSTYVRAGYGAENSYQVATGTQGKAQKLRYSAHISQFFSDGISNLDEKTPPNDDDDAYRNSSASFNVGYDFSSDATLDLNHFFTRTKNEFDDALLYDGVSEPYSKGWIQNTNAVLQLPVISIWDMTLSAGRSVDDTDSYDKLDLDPLGRTDFRTTRQSASWQNDFAVTDKQTLTAGIDYYNDHLDSSNEYYDLNQGKVVKDRDNIAYFAQYLLSYEFLDLQAGLRKDDNEAFGQNITRDFAIGFKLPASHRLTLAYGTAFKAPTLNDLYFPPDLYGQGNPDLKPQNAKNYEIGIRGDYTRWQWSLNGYRNKVDNLIIWLPVDPGDPNNYAWGPNNVAKAKIRGAEFVVSTRVQDWQIQGSFDYVDPRDEATDNLLPKRAQRSVKLDVDRSFGAWGIGLSWRAQSDRYGDADNTRTYHTSGYGLLDLRADYEFSKQWQAQLQLDNVLDQEYVLNRASGGVDYNQPGFGWFATLTYRM
jgi:vitamin B12 transporter